MKNVRLGLRFLIIAAVLIFIALRAWNLHRLSNRYLAKSKEYAAREAYDERTRLMFSDLLNASILSEEKDIERLESYRTAKIKEFAVSGDKTELKSKQLYKWISELDKTIDMYTKGIENTKIDIAKENLKHSNSRDYHRKLKEKYYHASLSPFLPLEPYPPDPDY